MSGPGTGMSRAATRVLRRHLVGPRQRWAFAPPPAGWTPPPVERTSLYLHVPFCRDRCPYCPYTTVPYREGLVQGWERAALAETDLWAAAVGPAEVTSIYIGGGTPTLALESVARVLERMRARFRLTGDVCIETSPSAVDEALPERLVAAGVTMVSLGVESFQARHLRAVGRRYTPDQAEEALARLAGAGFAGLNADLMIALPEQTAADVVSDLDRAAQLGAGQITVYPLFTFPYTAVGAYRRRAGVGMPRLAARHEHYRAVTAWAARRGYRRVSVWSFRRGDEPRYSSVTRDGYLGVGPGAGSHLPDGFVLNTFDLAAWEAALAGGAPPVALRMPFSGHMAGWWWLYWRFYDTRIPLAELNTVLGGDAAKARRWLRAIESAGLAHRTDGELVLTDAGCFWLHLAQNHFALAYVDALWTAGRERAWPGTVAL
ncbi:MAG TPA: radical SAM protein [Thermoleophilia bacterium]|nr:radical SAM protein [Thermoleophilia bacterium]